MSPSIPVADAVPTGSRSACPGRRRRGEVARRRAGDSRVGAADGEVGVEISAQLLERCCRERAARQVTPSRATSSAATILRRSPAPSSEAIISARAVESHADSARAESSWKPTTATERRIRTGVDRVPRVASAEAGRRARAIHAVATRAATAAPARATAARWRDRKAWRTSVEESGGAGSAVGARGRSAREAWVQQAGTRLAAPRGCGAPAPPSDSPPSAPFR